MGRVRFGLSNVHYAVWDSVEKTYKNPVRIPGAVNLSIEAEGDTNTFYADNTAYYVTSSNAGYSGDLEIAALEKDDAVALLGWEVDDNGLLYEPADALPADFALLYQIDGDPTKQRGVLYSVKLTRPSMENGTTEDSTEPQTLTCSFNAIGREFEIAGETRSVLKASVESSDSGYATFMDAVAIPTKAAATDEATGSTVTEETTQSEVAENPSV